METIKYLITDNQISFYKNEEVRVINKSSNLNGILYSQLKECLPNNNVIDIPVTSEEKVNFLLQNLEKIPTVKDRMGELTSAGLPTEPFVNFLKKCPKELIEKVEVLALAGTTSMPLTWDGNVVLYQRASYMQGETLKSWAGDNFAMGHEVNKMSYVSDFESIVNGTCPDAGPVFEVVVQPQDIVEVRNKGKWTVQRLIQMSALGLHPAENTKADTAIVEFVTNCVGDGKQAIRIPYNAGTAAKMVNAMFDTPVSASSNQIVPVRTQLVSC